MGEIWKVIKELFLLKLKGKKLLGLGMRIL